MEERGVQLEWQVDDAMGMISSDPATLRLVINNLFDNALSYGRFPGTLRIAISRQGERVELRMANPVADPIEDPERWFEPFFRRDSARHDHKSHLGIGLTLSREAIQAVGGTLSARMDGQGRVEFMLAMPALGA
jgi:two-component system sensor histidine kinase GlrK